MAIERTKCIYCKELLTQENEIQEGFHQKCQEEAEISNKNRINNLSINIDNFKDLEQKLNTILFVFDEHSVNREMQFYIVVKDKKIVEAGIKEFELKELLFEKSDYADIESLDLSGSAYGEIFLGLGKMPKLKKLNLSNCGLLSLDPSYLHFPNSLLDLNLSWNTIMDISDGIFTSQNMHSIDMSDNYITFTPEMIKQLPNCQVLNITRSLIPVENLNNLKKFSQLIIFDDVILYPNQLRNLQSYKLNYYGYNFTLKDSFTMERIINALYQEVLQDSLEVRTILLKNFSNNKSFEFYDYSWGEERKLPEEVFLLENFDELNLDSCNIKNDPEITDVCHFKTLIFSNNYKGIFPNWIYKMTNLETLDITNSYFTNVSEEIFNLKKLRKLIYEPNFTFELQENETFTDKILIKYREIELCVPELINLDGLLRHYSYYSNGWDGLGIKDKTIPEIVKVNDGFIEELDFSGSEENYVHQDFFSFTFSKLKALKLNVLTSLNLQVDIYHIPTLQELHFKNFFTIKRVQTSDNSNKFIGLIPNEGFVELDELLLLIKMLNDSTDASSDYFRIRDLNRILERANIKVSNNKIIEFTFKSIGRGFISDHSDLPIEILEFKHLKKLILDNFYLYVEKFNQNEGIVPKEFLRSIDIPKEVIKEEEWDLENDDIEYELVPREKLILISSRSTREKIVSAKTARPFNMTLFPVLNELCNKKELQIEIIDEWSMPGIQRKVLKTTNNLFNELTINIDSLKKLEQELHVELYLFNENYINRELDYFIVMNKQKIVELVLKNTYLKSIPLEIMDYPDIETLDLTNNLFGIFHPEYFTYLDESENFASGTMDSLQDSFKLLLSDLAKFKKLRKLHLSNCGLGKLEVSTFFPDSLVELNLSHNYIYKVSESIKQLKNIKKLDLSNNGEQITDEILENLPEIEELNIANTVVGIKNLDNLKKFSKIIIFEDAELYPNQPSRSIFNYVNYYGWEFSLQEALLLERILYQLEDEVNYDKRRKLIQIFSIDLSYRKIFTLPKEVFEIRSFGELNLEKCEIENEPEIPTNSYFRELNYRNNNAEEFPKWIYGMTNLEELEISGNKFKTISKKLLNLNKLQVIVYEPYFTIESEDPETFKEKVEAKFTELGIWDKD